MQRRKMRAGFVENYRDDCVGTVSKHVMSKIGTSTHQNKSRRSSCISFKRRYSASSLARDSTMLEFAGCSLDWGTADASENTQPNASPTASWKKKFASLLVMAIAPMQLKPQAKRVSQMQRCFRSVSTLTAMTA